MLMRDPADFRYPRRSPLAVVAVVVLVGLVGLHCYRRRGAEPPAAAGDQAEEATLEQVELLARETVEPVVTQKDAQEIAQSLSEARALQAQGDLVGARAAYLAVLGGAPSAAVRREAETSLGRINCELVLSPAPMPEKTDYVVQPGDSVDRIAKRFGTTIDLIATGNRMTNPNLIKVGDRLRILKGEFAIRVNKSRNDLVLTLDDRFFKRYSVGTGKFDRTPEGSFRIADKIKEPPWWRPDGRCIPFGDPENILGTRWMSIRATDDTPDLRGYGIHGTWDNSSIGKAESAGCVRMRNQDVEELYTLVPLGTSVTIEP